MSKKIKPVLRRAATPDELQKLQIIKETRNINRAVLSIGSTKPSYYKVVRGKIMPVDLIKKLLAYAKAIDGKLSETK